MIKKIFLLLKNKEVMLYLFFGVLTTVVNIISLIILVDLFHIDYLIANMIAWFLSIVFAYITNKIWVFESKNKQVHVEFSLFVGGRIFSGVVDESLMYLLVSVLGFNLLIAKLVSQIVVVILNYVLSKGIVFK
ncbi:MAG: GtrA family protein [Methanobrevibacter sp.]|jgi:putative flippase GtrA|nr:GtrA family protein [Candidatus Methanovirga australis]